MKSLKPFTTNEITKIIHKSITIKIDKTIKHLGQEHLHITTIDKNNAKLDVTRIPAIKMVYSYDVTFVKEFIIWLSNVQKNCDNYYTQEVVLNQSDFDHPDKLKNLESETWNAAVLDSGATNTVASKIWFNCYINSSNSEEKSKIQHHIGTNVYRFGNGKLVQAVENKDLPIVTGGEHVMLNTDIVPSDIPLLLSRKSMKRAGMTIDFKNDQAVAFPQKNSINKHKIRTFYNPNPSLQHYIKQHRNRYKYSSGSHSNKRNKNQDHPETPQSIYTSFIRQATETS